MKIYTIGHSTRTADEFVALLEHYRIDVLADVRTVPRSRHTPQFNADALDATLADHGVRYRHLAALGGLRHTRKDSINTGWRNASFRGYADHMQTQEFRDGIDELLGLARGHTAAIMCAEAVPWRCHRSMIGDGLIVRGFDVLDIFDARSAKEESLTTFAIVEGTGIRYPDPEELEVGQRGAR